MQEPGGHAKRGPPFWRPDTVFLIIRSPKTGPKFSGSLEVQNLSKVEEYGYQVLNSTPEARDLELTDPDIKPKDGTSFRFKVGINYITEIDSSLP